jgi:biotin synthase
LLAERFERIEAIPDLAINPCGDEARYIPIPVVVAHKPPDIRNKLSGGLIANPGPTTLASGMEIPCLGGKDATKPTGPNCKETGPATIEALAGLVRIAKLFDHALEVHDRSIAGSGEPAHSGLGHPCLPMPVPGPRGSDRRLAGCLSEAGRSVLGSARVRDGGFGGRPVRCRSMQPASYLDVLARLRQALVIERRRVALDELVRAAGLPAEAVPSLAALAHEVRLVWCGSSVEVEGILSAKTGGCPEDCHFCAQSSRFDSPVLATPFLDPDEVLAAARETAELGASEFCIVLAVRGPDERTLDRILALVPRVRAETGLRVAVSAGILTIGQADRLAAGGVHRYNHNLETARSFFDQVVTTHTWDERWETCRLVQRAGMELCCGVLLGMGESDEQRLELIGQLAVLGPAEVPINFLDPRPGTPLGIRKPLRPLEALRWIALFRLGLPDAILRYAGGRELTLRGLQALGMTAGINALIVGNYLTTLGRAPEEDLRMLDDLRMPIGALSSAI